MMEEVEGYLLEKKVVKKGLKDYFGNEILPNFILENLILRTLQIYSL
jgi:hypothetical protein